MRVFFEGMGVRVNEVWGCLVFSRVKKEEREFYIEVFEKFNDIELKVICL